jgi:hypothetical protein
VDHGPGSTWILSEAFEVSRSETKFNRGVPRLAIESEALPLFQS